MRRRTLLRSLAAASATGAAGTAAGHPLPTGDGSTPASTPTGGEPLGSLSLRGARELVTSPDGHTAYVATGDGIALVDLVSPGEPRLLAERTDLLADSPDGPMRLVQDLAISGDRLLVTGPANPVDSGAHGVVVFDVSDRENPERVAAVELDTRIHNADFDGRYAYVTANGRPENPLAVVDTERGEAVGSWSLFDADERWSEVHPALRPLHDVTVQGDRAYLAYWDAGTWMLDVSDPTDISLVARVRGRSRADLADVEDPSTERTEPPGNDHFVTVDEDAALLGVGGESWASEEDSDGPSGIELFDISDPRSPESLATIEPPSTSDPTRGGVLTTAHNFELVDDRLYSSWYQGGVRVHDVREPSDPRQIFRWRDASATSFWTAQRGAGCFVASSTAALDSSVSPGVYTFPDPALSAPTQTATDADGDGFGVAAALAAVGLGAWRLARRQ